MIITQENAVVVSKLFTSLTDERFTMRTLGGIRKAAGGDAALTDSLLANAAAELGMPIKRRIRDDAMLIERPVSVIDLQALIVKVDAVAAGTEQPFEIDFAPIDLPEQLPDADHDIGAHLEGGAPSGSGTAPADEDDQFQS